jgi:hypothetical protein
MCSLNLGEYSNFLQILMRDAVNALHAVPWQSYAADFPLGDSAVRIQFEGEQLILGKKRVNMLAGLCFGQN